MTQLDYAFTVQKGDVNGNAPSAVTDVVISEDGTIFAKQENGETQAALPYRAGKCIEPGQAAADGRQCLPAGR